MTSHRKRIEDEALHWVVRAKSGRMTGGERDRLDMWLQADAAHAEAFAYMGELWTATDLLGDLASLEPIPPVRARRERGVGGRVAWPVAIAATLALSVGATMWWKTRPPTHATGTAELRRLALADGSVVDLAPRTRVKVRFTAGERRIALEGGEAMFTVAHDKSRPFIVEAEGGFIRAVGTRFDVHRGPEGVTVSVLEGVVEVKRPTGGAAAVLRVGDQAVYDGARLKQARMAEPARAEAWRRGYLEYHNETLERVLADANRYSKKPIVVDDEALKELRLTAVIKTASIADLPDNLEQMLPVDAIDDGGSEIRLRRKGS